MSSISFSFENPWYLLLLIPALAIVLTPYFLLPKRRRGGFKRIAPVVLHTLIATFLILVLSGFSIVRSSKDKNVILLVDLSGSMESVEEAVTARVDDILSYARENTPVGIVTFGADQICSLNLSENALAYELSPVDQEGSDFDDALEYAAGLLSSDKAKQIIILSDGKETDGDGKDMARYLATQGVRIDSVYFDTTVMDTAEVQISSLSVPNGVYVDEPALLIGELKTNTPCSISCTLYDNGNAISAKTVEMTQPSQMVEFEVTPKSVGLHSYRLLIQSESDTIALNNSIYSHVFVTGEPTVLLLTDTFSQTDRIKNILSEESTLELCLAKDAPKTIMELCKYDQIILSNVDYSVLPRNYDQMLQTYVEVYGRSLLVAGGTGTYVFGNMKDTKIEEMMPVSFDFKATDEGKSVSMMLVLDCSRSMTNNNSPNLSVAKQGAIRCVESMTENDYIGLVTFHTDAELRSPLVPATQRNKEELIRIISGLTTDQRTYYTEALRLAHNELKDASSEIKHVMFLSDGQPKDVGYNRVAKQIAADGITLSAIGLGFESEILEKLAETGSGRYYYVSSAASLPDLMLSETQMISVSSVVNEDTETVVLRDSALTSSIDADGLPMLKGYLGTTLKDGATTYIATEEGHPVYASWQVGLGTVAAFTGDLSGNWSSLWLRNQNAQKVLCNMVTTTVNEGNRASSILADFNVKGKNTEAVITSYTASAEDFMTLTAEISGSRKDYILMQTEPGVFRGEFETPKAGLYEITIIHSDPTQEMLDYLDTAVSVSYSLEYDAFREDGKENLEQICQYSEGTCAEDGKEAIRARISPVRQSFSPLVILSVLSMLLFLADVAIRKLRLKDVKNFLNRFLKKA